MRPLLRTVLLEVWGATLVDRRAETHTFRRNDCDVGGVGAALRRAQSAGQRSAEVVDALFGDRAAPQEHLRESARRADAHPIDDERAVEEVPARVDEAEHRADWEGVVEEIANHTGLTLDTFRELRLRPASDNERRSPLPHLGLDQFVLVALGVDDPGSRGRHDDVIDVGARSRDAPIVQYVQRTPLGECVEGIADDSLADRAGCPSLLVLGCVLEREE